MMYDAHGEFEPKRGQLDAAILRLVQRRHQPTVVVVVEGHARPVLAHELEHTLQHHLGVQRHLNRADIIAQRISRC